MHKVARTILVVSTSLLLLFGLGMLYSTSYASHGEAILRKQLAWIAIGGVGAVLICWKFDDAVIRKYSAWLLLMVSMPLVYLAFANVCHRFPETRPLARSLPLVGGLNVGSARWIRLGPVSLQPSELAKPLIILFLAGYMPRNARHAKNFWRGFFKPMLVVGLVVGLILLGGDLSSTGITGGVVFVAVFVGGMRLRYLFLILVGGALMAYTAINISPQRMKRVTTFRNPEALQQDEGYQLWHSQLALGSGGARGLGFTNSRMKRRYLPEAHTDFIVAIVGEELGFIGVVVLMALYVMFIVAALWLAALANDREGVILSACVGILFGLQSFVNISVVSGFGPTTGVTAPFVSYGGSSMIVSLIMVGLLLACSARCEAEAVVNLEEQQQKERRRRPRHESAVPPRRSAQR